MTCLMSEVTGTISITYRPEKKKNTCEVAERNLLQIMQLNFFAYTFYISLPHISHMFQLNYLRYFVSEDRRDIGNKKIILEQSMSFLMNTSQ
jgi:hypothetical protein